MGLGGSRAGACSTPLENEPDRLRSAISKTDGPQVLDLQRDALEALGVDAVNVYHDLPSGVGDDRVVYRGSLRGRSSDHG